MKELFTRHSVRQYADKPVEEEKINTLLKAAMAAPTAGNQREWEFVVVTDPEVKKTGRICLALRRLCRKGRGADRAGRRPGQLPLPGMF